MYFNFKKVKHIGQLTLIILIFCFFKAKAQLSNGVHTEIETQLTGTTNNTVPFWMRSNQYGSIPLNGVSGSLIGRLSKGYYSSKDDSLEINNFYWGFGLEARGNGGKSLDGNIIEAFAKIKYNVFQLKGGRSKDVMGLNGDTTLSSGNFAVSGNALGIPKMEISIPDYWRIPILDGLFSIKGTFAHGWVGKTEVSEEHYVDKNQIKAPQTYLHQKSFYGRLGKEEWKWQLEGGFSHFAFWGNERQVYGDDFELSPLKTFFYVATGKAYKNKSFLSSKIGNQIGSIDLAFTFFGKNYQWKIYRQQFYDVGALSKLANIADGLNGIAVHNNSYEPEEGTFQWKSILAEFFFSKNQAGYPWSKLTKSGDEDYYNNYYYANGWSYVNQGLGNPFVTRRDDARPGQAHYYHDYFINNRVAAIHLGVSGSLNEWEFLSKLSYSWNYGTFGTSPWGHSTATRWEPPAEPFQPVQQLSAFLSASKAFENGYKVGFSAGLDIGKLLPSSSGLQLSLKKVF